MKRVAVSLDAKKQQHLCSPTETSVKPGDTMRWDCGEPLLVFFPHGSPFVEGAGPFGEGQVVTVSTKPPLQGGEIFVAVTALSGTVRPTVGKIKVT